MQQIKIKDNQPVRKESSQQEKKRLEQEDRLNKLRAAGIISQNEINQYKEGIEAAKKINFVILFPCAIVTDATDLVPVVGLLSKLIFLPIIWYTYYITGTTSPGQDPKYKVEVSWKIKLIFRALGFGDLVPLVKSLPLTTISVFVIWRQTKLQIKEREKELEEWEKTLASLN